MAKYINLGELSLPFEAHTVDCNGETFVRLVDVQNFISNIKPADVAPVRHGRWILQANNGRTNYQWNVTAECSECCDEKKEIWAGFFPGVPDSMAREISLMDAEQVKLSNFCPNCGARMDGDDHRENGKKVLTDGC